MASVLSTVGLLLYIPIVVYVPALALSQGSYKHYYFISLRGLRNLILQILVEFKFAYTVLWIPREISPDGFDKSAANTLHNYLHAEGSF